MDKTLTLQTLWRLIVTRIRWIAGITLAVTAATAIITITLITPKYESEALLYVENTREASEALNINDINAAQKLVNTCVIIFQNDIVMQQVIDDLSLPYALGDFKKMVTLSSVNNTEVLRVKAESASPQESQSIVSSLITIAPKEFHRVVKSGSIEEISPASYNEQPSSPKLLLNIAVGFIAGLMISLITILLIETLDVTIRTDDDLYKLYDVPVFAEIMDFDGMKKGEYR